ncbi:MAG: DUF1499 domain-containing protein [Henriciella sp.]|nr:DUF1499 domain-containing protein [Henriciella sp.]
MPDFISFKSLQRPAKPNTYLVAPDGLCLASEPDQISPELDLSPEDAFSRIETIVETENNWIDLHTDPSEFRMRFVARSPIMRFKDDVDIAVLPSATGTGSQLAIYSRSRVGYSDLGANRKRVESLLEKLIAK